MENLTKEKSNLLKMGGVFLIILSVYLMVRVFTEFKNYGLREGVEMSVITVTGHGEVKAVPDIANVYFTISKDAKTVKEAQEMVAKVEKASLDFLKASGVAEKDIKTEDSSFYPKYEYKYKAVAPCSEYGCPPSSGNNVIVGYTASESITVKVRNTDDAGKLMQGLGDVGVTQLSGPSFDIDDSDSLKAEARKEAIDEAKSKAEALAKDLGVKLVRISNFSEGGGYFPMMYGKAEAMDGGVRNTSAPAEIPKGENTISSDVTISYEIR